MHLSSFLRSSLGAALAAAIIVAAAPSPSIAAVPQLSVKPAPSVGFDGLVYASATVGSTVYLGGSFRNAVVDGRSTPRKRLAAVDARTGKLLPWAPPADGTVLALTASGSSLYASGKFKTVGGQQRSGLAGIDLNTGAVTSLKHAVTGEGTALAAGGGRLYLGGSISAVNGRAVRNLAAFRLSDGAVDSSFRPSADGQVRALYLTGSRLYVGGSFKSLNNADRTARLAALNLDDGRVDTSFQPQTPYATMALTASAGTLYAGLAGPGGRVAAYRNTGDLVWSTVTDGDVQALTAVRGAIYAGGHFTEACTGPSRTATSWCPGKLRSQPKLAALNSENGDLLDWNPRSNGKWGVLTLSAGAGVVAVGGEFTAFNGTARPYFALFLNCSYGCGGRVR